VICAGPTTSDRIEDLSVGKDSAPLRLGIITMLSFLQIHKRVGLLNTYGKREQMRRRKKEMRQF
jgi:hypothetical protein